MSAFYSQPAAAAASPLEVSDPIADAVNAGRGLRMTHSELAFLLAAAARTPRALLAGRSRLEPRLFEPTEAHYVLFWQAVVAASAETELPEDPAEARELVGIKAVALASADTSGVYYTPQAVRAVTGPGGLIDSSYGLTIGPATEAEVFRLLARFLHERIVVDPLRRALAGISAGETIKDIDRVAEEVTRHAMDLAGLSNDPGTPAILDVDDFLPPGPQISTTAVKFLDSYMNGGQAPGEAYVVLGPTGGGKSSLGTQIAYDSAALQATAAAEIGADRVGHWYYFSWELNELELRPRIYAHAAKVHHDSFRRGPDGKLLEPFSTAAALKPYESDPYVNSAGNPPCGERERIAAVRQHMSGRDANLHIVDYSGRVPGQGLGGVEEAAAYLRRERARGRRIAGVVVDYAGLAVNRLISHRKLRPDAEYPLLASFVDQVRNQISQPYGCSAWVLHQFHGDVTKRQAGAKTHHADARGSRNFADNSDFAFGLSPYHKTTGLLVVSMSKHRRAPGHEEGTIVHFDGRFGTFRVPSGEYVVDPFTRDIVPKAYTDAVGKAVRTVRPSDAAASDPAAPPTGPLPGDPRGAI